MLKITELDVHGYHRVVRGVNEEVGLDVIIAIHNTNLGPGLGGCRMMKYDSYEDHLADALNLSKGMTYKNAIAGLALGGGKTSINLTPTGGEKTEEMIASFCEVLNYVNKDGLIYITAGDVGTGKRELDLIAAGSKFVQGQEGTDSGVATGFGVFNAILGALRVINKDVSVSKVAINGLGKVGSRLARFLVDAGAEVVLADFHHDLAVKLAEELGDKASVRPYDEIHSTVCDVYAPCAVGGAINKDTVDTLYCDIVCGGANNQLATADMGAQLASRGILYVPDYVANAGGVIIIEKRGTDYVDLEYDHPEIKSKLENIADTSYNILMESLSTKTEPALVANKMAEDIFKGHDLWPDMGGAMVG